MLSLSLLFCKDPDLALLCRPPLAHWDVAQPLSEAAHCLWVGECGMFLVGLCSNLGPGEKLIFFFCWIPEIATKAQRKLASVVPLRFSGHPSCPAGHSTSKRNSSLPFAFPWRFQNLLGTQATLENIFLDWKAALHNICSPACLFLSWCWESCIPLATSQDRVST